MLNCCNLLFPLCFFVAFKFFTSMSFLYPGKGKVIFLWHSCQHWRTQCGWHRHFQPVPCWGTLVHFHFQLQQTTYLEPNPHLESELFPQDKFLDMGLLGLRMCPLYPSQKAERHLPSTPSPTRVLSPERTCVGWCLATSEVRPFLCAWSFIFSSQVTCSFCVAYFFLSFFDF